MTTTESDVRVEVQAWTRTEQDIREEYYFLGTGAAEVYLCGFNPDLFDRDQIHMIVAEASARARLPNPSTSAGGR